METEGISECFDKCACARSDRAVPGSIRRVSRVLVDLLERRSLTGRSVLELGCGLGALSISAVSRGAARANGIDLSPVAIREASRLAKEAGLADKVSFTVGDGAHVELPRSDVVILDKVICCYPRVDALIENSVRAAGSTYAFVLPFSSGLRGVVSRVAITLENAIRRVKRQSFRAYVHDVGKVEARVREAGLQRVESARRLIWYVAVYERGS